MIKKLLATTVITFSLLTTTHVNASTDEVDQKWVCLVSVPCVVGISAIDAWDSFF